MKQHLEKGRGGLLSRPCIRWKQLSCIILLYPWFLPLWELSVVVLAHSCLPPLCLGWNAGSTDRSSQECSGCFLGSCFYILIALKIIASVIKKKKKIKICDVRGKLICKTMEQIALACAKQGESWSSFLHLLCFAFGPMCIFQLKLHISADKPQS